MKFLKSPSCTCRPKTLSGFYNISNHSTRQDNSIHTCKNRYLQVVNNFSEKQWKTKKKSTIAMVRIYVFIRVGFWSNRASRFTPWLPKHYATGHCTQTVVNNRPPKAKKLENEDQKNVRRGYEHKIMLKEKLSLQVVINLFYILIFTIFKY